MKYRTVEEELNEQGETEAAAVMDLADLMDLIHANDSIQGVRIA